MGVQVHDFENSSAEAKVEIAGAAFLGYLLYTLTIWLFDAFDLTCYLTGLPQMTVLSRVAAVLFLCAFCYFARKKIHVIAIKADGLFYIGALFLLFFGFCKGIQPDTSSDVQNYHILAQLPGFTSYFADNVASGDFQLFGFRLPDRLFYLFRMLLGYRMGTILNSVVMILVYLQVIGLLNMLCGKRLASIRQKIDASFKHNLLLQILFKESVLAFILVFYHDVCIQTATYMVDILPIPFALEMLRLVLKKRTNSKPELLYFALLAGLFFGMKMTNIIFIIPMLVLFVIKNREGLSPQILIGCAGLCALPASVYFVYNGAITGNPVFPYFNALFRSEYYPLQNFKDRRWGPSNLDEIILWPFYMIFMPEYHQSEIPNLWPYPLTAGLTAMVYYAIKAFRRKEIMAKSHLGLSVIFISSLYFWAVTTGHIRYFIFGGMLNGLLAVCLIVDITFIDKKTKFKRIFAAFLLLIFVLQPVVGFGESTYGREWSWRILDKDFYLSNLTCAFQDREFAVSQQVDSSSTFVLSKATGSVAHLINSECPIVFYSYVHNKIKDENLQNSFRQSIIRRMESGDEAYDIGWQYYALIEEQIEINNMNGFYINQAEFAESKVLTGKNSVLLYHLIPLRQNQSNVIYYADIEGSNQIKIGSAGNVTLKASIGLTSQLGWFSEPFVFTIEASSNGKNGKVVYRQDVEEGQFYQLDASLDLSGLSGEVTLKFVLKDQSGKLADDIDPYRMAVINPEIVY